MVSAGRSRWPIVVLAGLVLAYFAVSLALSELRYLEFSTSNWDMGVFQQMLWSTLHGHPMYESGDWELYGNPSYLEVHPAFVTYLLVPFYALWPSAQTLFVIQSGAAALAAVPLYLIGVRVLGRPWPAVGIAALYVGFAPLLLANLFDFHLELLFPLEIFSLFYCWLSGRYKLGLVVAAIALLTLEVMPFIIAFLALFFLLPPLRPWLERLRAHYRQGLAHPADAVRPFLRELSAWLHQRPARWSAALLAIAVVAYPLLRLLEWVVVPALLPPPPNAAFGGALVAAQASGLGFGAGGAFTISLGHKLGFWLLLVGLIGFLPLFAPRALLLSVPWFVFTLQSPMIVWTSLGFHYPAVAVAPLFIAAVYGFPEAERLLGARIAAYLARPPASPSATRPATVAPSRRFHAPSFVRRRPRETVAAVALVAVLSANVYIGPLNPQNQRLNGPLPGFNVEYDIPPGFHNVEQLASLVPAAAQVLTSANLFPLVANDLNAYALVWTANSPPQLPYGPGHLPDYVLIAYDQSFAVPSWLTDAISHRGFGLRAEVDQSPVGEVYLWVNGYRGSTTLIGPA